MTAKAKSTAKGRSVSKGKAARRPTVKERARAIVADVKGYSDETRHAIKNALDENSSDLAELVRRAEGGDEILDARGPVGGNAAEGQPDVAAIAYAQRAYGDALDYYHAHQGDPFALSRLAVVYDEQQPGDFNMVITLPGHMRDRAVTDEELREVIIDAERVARTLEDPECSEAYRKAFGSIYTDHLFNVSSVDMEHPAVVRVLLPLLMLDLWRSRPANAETTLEILSITLRDTLNSDEVSERTRVCAG
jgi:hypothetical protein